MNLRLQSIIISLSHLLQATKTYLPIIKKFAIFACGALLTRSISLLLTPITMRILSPADYGLLALANSFISILTAFIGCGLRQMLPLHYFHQTSDDSRIQLILDIVCIYIYISVLVLCILGCNINVLNRYIFLNQAPTELIIISLGISFIYFFVELFYQLLQYQQHAWLLTKIQFFTSLVTIACNLSLLCVLKMGVCSILIGQAVGMCIICVLILKLFFDHHGYAHLSFKRSRTQLRTYLCMGVPFMPSMLCGLFLASGDRWVLAHLSTMHNVGIYSVANTLAQCVNMISFYAITGSYVPHMLNLFATEPDNICTIEQQNKRAMWASMIASFLVLTIGFVSCKSLLYWFIPQTFHASINYMYTLLIGSIFLLGTYFLNCIIQFKQKSIFLGLILCLPATLNLLLNMLFIPYFELHGCVIATLISYVVYFIATYAYNLFLLKPQSSSVQNRFGSSRSP